MKWALTLLVLLAELLGASAAPGGRTGAVQLAGKEYVRATDWAGASDLQIRWVKREESLQAANQSHRILLKVDSREAQFNGVELRLLFPVIYRDGQAYLSRLDAQTTFQPLLAPTKISGRSVIRNICLDPGHGGKDPGNFVGAKQEKRYNLLLGKDLRAQSLKPGLKFFLTPGGENFIDLEVPPPLENRRNADFFII